MPSQQVIKADSRSDGVTMNSPDSCSLIRAEELPRTNDVIILGEMSLKTWVKTPLRKKSYIGCSSACNSVFESW